MKLKFENFLLATTAFLLVLCLIAPVHANVGLNVSKASASEAEVGDTVASVNAAAITRDQFNNALGYQQDIAAIRGVTLTDEQLPTLKYQVLENLINQELLYQESERYGISVDENEIDKTYEEKKQKANFSTDAEFEEALKKSNKTVASYREEIRKGLAIDKFVQAKFTNQTVVSDTEAKQYYDSNPTYFEQAEQVRVSHIMARVASDAEQTEKDAARAKIEEAKKRLEAGEDFASVAGEVSEDDNTKSNGGDLGYLSKGQTPQSFEDAAFALNMDEVSDIVETGSGYHIIKLTDRQDARTVGYEEAKSEIVDLLKTNKVNTNVNSYITELKIRATIVTYPLDQ